MKRQKALTKARAIIVIVVILIALIGIAIYISSRSSSSVYESTTSVTSSSTTSSASSTTSGVLTIYGAGAFSAILNYLASEFQNQTGIVTKVVPGGSFGLAAQIANSPQPPQLFVPVAYIQAVQLQGSKNAGWAIAFLSDQMAIVYSNFTTTNPYWNQLYSNYTMAMQTNNTRYWYNFFYLLSTKFSLGVADPDTDPEGLYAYLILEMAGKLYANNSIYYFVNLAKQHIVNASTTAQYVAPLKSGKLDIVFSYKSYAISQKLSYLQLPPWLSFGYFPNELNWYHSFNYTITVNGQKVVIKGNPVYLYITIPKGASNVDLAYKFINFLLSHESELSKFGVTPIYPALLFYENATNVPSQIMNLVNEGELKYAGNFSAI